MARPRPRPAPVTSTTLPPSPRFMGLPPRALRAGEALELARAHHLLEHAVDVLAHPLRRRHRVAGPDRFEDGLVLPVRLLDLPRNGYRHALDALDMRLDEPAAEHERRIAHRFHQDPVEAALGVGRERLPGLDEPRLLAVRRLDRGQPRLVTLPREVRDAVGRAARSGRAR